MLYNPIRKFVYYKHIASGKLGDMSWNDWEHVQKDPARRSQFEFIRIIDLDNPGGEKAKQDLISIKLDNQAKLLTLIESDKANLSKDFTDTTTKEIFEKYFKAKDRKNELKAQFGIVINVILRDIQKGTQIDIIPPQIEVGANAEERKANESVKSEAFQQIPRLKKLYSQEPSQKQLPFTVEIDETLLNESHLDSKNDTQKKPEN